MEDDHENDTVSNGVAPPSESVDEAVSVVDSAPDVPDRSDESAGHRDSDVMPGATRSPIPEGGGVSSQAASAVFNPHDPVQRRLHAFKYVRAFDIEALPPFRLRATINHWLRLSGQKFRLIPRCAMARFGKRALGSWRTPGR